MKARRVPAHPISRREGGRHVKRLLAALALLAITPSLTEGAKSFEKVGTIGGQFLKIGIGARATGMGGAFVSVADDASSIYWNPAGVARVNGSAVSVNHLSWPAEVALDQAAYVFSLSFLPGNLAVSAKALTVDDMEVTDVHHPDGTGEFFDAGDMAFTLTYARSLTDKFSTGVNANWLHSGLADFDANSISFDFGTLYDTGFRSLKIGMAIQSIGADLSFSDDPDTDPVKLPILFRVGMSMNVYQAGQHSLLSAAEFSHPPDNSERVNWGGEYAFRNFFFLRGGYNFNYDSEKLAGGLGVKFPVSASTEARLDYSYTDMQTLGSAHRFSLDLGF
jgi:long-subunit fatty acid transport protein